MLENWLSPIDITKIIGDEKFKEFSLVKHIGLHKQENGIPSLENVPVVFIGIDKNADNIRRCLYKLAWHFNDFKFVDLGNVRKQDDNFITQVLSELIDGGILPIILGGKKTKLIPQFLAHKDLRKYTNIAIISETIPFDNDSNDECYYISHLLKRHIKSIFNLSFLGYQAFLCNRLLKDWISDNKYDGLRLGAIRTNVEDAEPIIRDADTLLFHLDALKYAECPGIENPSPNGLFADEACQLARYAGMSDKLGSFSIYGYNPKKDIENQTAQVVAQMIWYFIDGYTNRKMDYPVNNSGMTEYVVDFKDFDYQITFWKSNNSGRWWMQIPIKRKKDLNRHELIPCSYNDYKFSCSGELPERLLLALDRFS